MLARNQPHSDITTQLRTLLRRRKEIIEEISKLSKRKYFLNKPAKHTDEPGNPQGEPRKLIKRQAPIVDEKQGEEDKKKPHPAETEQTEEAKRVNAQQLLRNKRIFGSISSHLMKAKNNIEAEKPKIEEKNRIMEQVLRREREKNEEIVQGEVSRLTEQVRALEEEKETNSRQILRIQNQILLQHFSRYSTHLQSFLFTAAEPSVAWKPAKQFEAAKTLLGDKQKQFELKRKEIESSISQYEEKFDYNTFMAENEREYYENLLKNYYLSLQNHYLTHTQPRVMWMTAQPMEGLKKLASERQEALQKIECERRKLCEKHYGEQMERNKKAEKEEPGEDGNSSPSQKQSSS